MGDFNAHEFNDGYVDIIGTIRGAPAPPTQTVHATRDVLDPNLVNLLDSTAKHDRYSYVFDGSAETLDRMRAGPNAFRTTIPRSSTSRCGERPLPERQ